MATPRSRTRSPGIIKYAYMFSPDKSPTLQFDALLRAIARHIISEIGDRKDSHLTPTKLAAFYKAVGGDYDPLFLSTPHETIAYMWTVTGCQHSLQPGPNDYAPPSVPALTPRGFSRWESVEILLGPEEHVPFIQYAARHWRLTHPETGEAFPPDLPADVFPRRADPEIDRWHKTCADQMRAEAHKEQESMPSPKSEAKSHPQPPPHPQPQSQSQSQSQSQPQTHSRSQSKAETKVRQDEQQSQPKTEAKPEPATSERDTKYVYVHTTTTARDPFQTTPPRSRASDAGFFEKSDRQFTYVRVGKPGAEPNQRAARQSPDKQVPRTTRPGEETRRRSFSDYGSPKQAKREPIHHSYSGAYLSPESSRPRQHSQPRHHSSDESSADESSPEHVEIKTRRKHRSSSSPQPGFRRVPQAPVPPPAASDPLPPFRGHRSEIRPEDHRRRSSPLGSIREKMPEAVSSMSSNGHSHSQSHGSDRPRNLSRQSSSNDPMRSHRSREQVPPSRLSQNFSDLASEGSSDAEPARTERQRRRREREREQERERERERERDRERDRDRDRYRDRGRAREMNREPGDERESSGQRGDRHYPRRPETERRPSSHTDTDRRTRDPVSWEREGSLRGRDHMRDERRKWDRRPTDEDNLNGMGGLVGRRFNETTTYS